MRKIVFLLLFISIYSYGFEIQGYSTGMSKEAVKSLASKYYQIIEKDEEAIEARGTGKDGMYFVFCKGKLATVNIFWDANIRNLVLVSSDFQSKFGNAITRTDVKSLNSHGTYYSLNSYWYKGKDTFSILYSSSENAQDSMTVSYSSSTSCWR
jgi:hypothetical protein